MINIITDIISTINITRFHLKTPESGQISESFVPPSCLESAPVGTKNQLHQTDKLPRQVGLLKSQRQHSAHPAYTHNRNTTVSAKTKGLSVSASELTDSKASLQPLKIQERKKLIKRP